ncbi:MAG: cytochrome c oxidase assembly protein [Chloroflexi bacterium]|nr:cytochrome c oxidase assembly protein [Chloroflexota bacterium]
MEIPPYHWFRWNVLPRALGVALLALAGPVGLALAHDGAPPEPHDLWTTWSADPLVIVGLIAGGWLYARGTRRLWRRGGTGCGVRGWQAASYAGGLLAVAVALISPLDALGSALFSAHMVQHLLLFVVAAPLLVLGMPLLPLLWSLGLSTRRGLGGWWRRTRVLRAAWAALTHPAMAWILHAATMWVWHAPPLFDATLRSGLVHAAEHTTFLGTALLFWWSAFGLTPRLRGRRGIGVISIFAMAMQSGLLGAAIALSAHPWYTAYAQTTRIWGLTPLEDQQIAGLIMWVPAGTAYLIAALGLLGVLLQASERPTPARAASPSRQGHDHPGAAVLRELGS